MTTSESQKWFWLSVLVGTGVLFYLLSPILTPFLLAAILSYLVNPAVRLLVARRLPRIVAVIGVFVTIVLLALLVTLGLIPLLEKQILIFINKWPGYIDWLQHTAIPWLQAHLGIEGQGFNLDALKEAFAEHWRQVGGTAASIVGAISKSSVAIMAWIANLVLVPVVTFYLLRDWDGLLTRLKELIPQSRRDTVIVLTKECDGVLGTFLRGQLTVMLALGLVYATGLWIAGIELAVLIGILAGIVSFVPYLGLIVGVAVAGIASVVQFHDLSHLLPVVAVFGIGQLLEGFVLTPLLIGDKVGLHPVAVIFAVMAGGQLFGFFGILLALPVAAVVVVLLRHVHQRYLDSELYAGDND